MKKSSFLPVCFTVAVVAFQATPSVAAASPEAGEARSSHLSSVLNTIPDIIFYKDLDGVYQGGNEAWADLVGEPRDAMIGKTDFDLFPKQLAEFFRSKDQEMLASGKTGRNEEWVDYPDGRRVLLDTVKTPWLDSEGEVLGVLGICRDITDLRAAHADSLQALEDANASFYSALAALFTGDTAPMDAVWSHSKEVSLQGPFGARMDGWEAVQAHFKEESTMKMAGTVLCENKVMRAVAGMGYIVCVEEGQDMTVDGNPITVHHRATNIFQLEEDGKWKMVHHHTDLAPVLDAAVDAAGDDG